MGCAGNGGHCLFETRGLQNQGSCLSAAKARKPSMCTKYDSTLPFPKSSLYEGLQCIDSCMLHPRPQGHFLVHNRPMLWRWFGNVIPQFGGYFLQCKRDFAETEKKSQQLFQSQRKDFAETEKTQFLLFSFCNTPSKNRGAAKLESLFSHLITTVTSLHPS
jgi:hypothetical protein